ncbi:MAG: glycosyltransferase family 2 protein, partial [Alphaproteobacteria bacterium]|nr:glycosyltransferase family 2 protein [Alphaproteobacteria bacterium]
MVHKITYISTLYNKSDYIIRVLESICNQDTNNFIKEIIVIDDGSTDDSYQKVLDFKRYSPIPINVISQANK